MSALIELQDLITELEHIVELLEDAEDNEELENAYEELNNQAGTIHTILAERK